MKNVLIRLFSIITLSVLFTISSFGQTMIEEDFDEVIDKMILSFTDFSLKGKKSQANYLNFQKEVKPNSTYYDVVPFLKELEPTPVVTLEIVELLHHEYKERYNSKATNQRLHDIVASVFEEEAVRKLALRHPNSFPSFKTDWKGELRTEFNLDVPEEVTIDETLPESIDKEYEETQSNPISPVKNNVESASDFTTDYAPEVDSSNGLGNSFLLFGFMFLLIAFALYFLYQRNKDTIVQQITTIKKKPKQPKKLKPTITKVSKVTHSNKSKTKNWLAPKPKKETYADKINNLQTLIQTQKNTLSEVKEDIFKMHHEISDLTEKAGFEVIDEHIKQLSQKLDEVEQKQKELILVLDTQTKVEEPNIDKSEESRETSTDASEQEALLIDATKDLQTETVSRYKEPETVTESNYSNEIPVIQIRKLSSPPDLFFMPIPNKDGSFDVENWTAKFEDTESVYRFEMINHYEAKFQFYNEKKTVRRAISGYDIYIKPVCKALNAFNTNATEVKTQNHGVVYRDGDKWKLKEKTLVYYQ